VIVENRAGAGGTIGSAFVAKARPDGYTLLLGTVSTNAVAGSLFAKLPYDPVKSFTPITEIASVPELLVVNPSVPANSVKELVDYLKARPGKVAFASGGPGSASHLAAELFMSMTGTKMTHVPYKGSGPALQDTLGNHTQVMFDVVMTSHSQVKAGALKALGVTSQTRSQVMPNVPTISEAGVPGYEAIVWFGLFAPADTPADITQKLHREFTAALKAPKVQELLAGQGAVVVASSPADFSAKIAAETAKWAKVVKDGNVQVE
jgi:tripartite-type tricarboxylate transporter receptor subunit TctC